jgi:hypothetical protein
VLDDEEVDEDELVEDDELVDEEEDTLPLDELVLETLPLEVEVLEPPLDVLVLDPPLEVEVEPPLEVEETTMLPPLDPPPKKPPAKKPPPNPPKPPLPPTTTGGEPPPTLMTGWGGNGIGAPCEVTVTTCGWQAVVLVVTTRLRTWRTGRFTTACLITDRLIEVRALAWVSATWTAPPPMIAPPHAQAHNFAKAIRTDMIVFPVWTRSRVARRGFVSSPMRTRGEQSLKFKRVYHRFPRQLPDSGTVAAHNMVNVPQRDAFRSFRHGACRPSHRGRIGLWRGVGVAIGPLGSGWIRRPSARRSGGRDVWQRC